MNGLEVVAKVREKLRRAVPVIILTGDISTATLRAIADADCVLLNKPVKLDAVMLAVHRALALKHAPPAVKSPLPAEKADAPGPPVIYRRRRRPSRQGGAAQRARG